MKSEPLGSMTFVGVAELMTTEVVTLTPDAKLQDAIRTMVTRGIRHIPIVEGERVVAIISDRNVRMMVTEHVDADERRRYLQETSVMDHASKPVTTIHINTTAPEAAATFIGSRIGCLPVVDEDGLMVGILTQTDMLQWIARDLPTRSGSIKPVEITGVFMKTQSHQLA